MGWSTWVVMVPNSLNFPSCGINSIAPFNKLCLFQCVLLWFVIYTTLRLSAILVVLSLTSWICNCLCYQTKNGVSSLIDTRHPLMFCDLFWPIYAFFCMGIQRHLVHAIFLFCFMVWWNEILFNWLIVLETRVYFIRSNSI